MEDIVISIPAGDISLLEQLTKKFGWKIYRPTAAACKKANDLFTAMRKQAAQQYEWSLDEINAEIAMCREENPQ